MRKNVLITGSSRGIGRAIAERFSTEPYNIILNCKDSTEQMRTLVTQLRLSNPNIIGVQADVARYEEAEKLFDAARENFGPIDILINNAGVSHIGLFQDMSHEEWEHLLAVNTGSVLNCSRLAVPDMIRKKEGVIVNISSVWGITGASCEAAYSASKSAVNGFTKALAKELGPCGIRVNAIACGVIDTEMNDRFSPEEKSALAEQIPLGRFGSAAQIANLCHFLSSDASGFITGQIITADGGMI